MIIHGDVLDVQTGSADGGFCTCTHYTSKIAFRTITKSPGGLELWASRAKYDNATGKLLDCGSGQGLYCAAKPTDDDEDEEDEEDADEDDGDDGDDGDGDGGDDEASR